MKLLYLTFLLLLTITSYGFSQNPETGINGRVMDEKHQPIPFANVVLFSAADSTMAKAGYAEENGDFHFTHLLPGDYFLNVSYVGFDTYHSNHFTVSENNTTALGEISMSSFTTELGEVVVTSTKPVVEVKPDKTVFNIEGSVNAIGNNGLELLRKAPGVVVDNNERLMLVGKTGVKVYIDGKQSILSGADLASYLKTLQSTQIEAIEIITQPSAKYEADGNAGIINIRLIKDKSLGTNATASLGYNQSIHSQYDANLNFNHRSKGINLFGNINYAHGEGQQYNTFIRYTPDIYAYQDRMGNNGWDNASLRAGIDVSSGKNSTFGVLFNGYMNQDEFNDQIHTYISPDETMPFTELLEGQNSSAVDRDNYNINGNYRFDNHQGSVLNIDVDYGTFTNEGNAYQPNYYYDLATNQLTDTRIFSSNTPTTIDIQTLKLDYEKPLFGGTAGAGFKIALVNTDNTYNFYDVVDGNAVLNTDRSNRFTYDENVNAGYINWNRQWKKLGFQFGVRVEQTDSKGELTSYKPQNNEKVDQEYVDVFPSGGVTYQVNQKHSLRLTYSRRIDRPNYQDLNPFEFKLDEITFQKGNPFLRPQFSNSVALTHTFNYMLNTTLTYSHTNDLMTQLTDTASAGAAFITTENVADQDLISLNVSYPFSVNKWWNVFVNTGVTNTHNQADFGDGKIVDISATSFNIYGQNTFLLPKKFSLEISGWYNSPGIWGGNFATDGLYSIDTGLQKKIWNDRGNIRIGISDIFKTTDWAGRNNFGGLRMVAMGGWESRQFKVNMTYLLGNSNVQGSRNRNTGLQEEAKRVKSGN